MELSLTEIAKVQRSIRSETRFARPTHLGRESLERFLILQLGDCNFIPFLRSFRLLCFLCFVRAGGRKGGRHVCSDSERNANPRYRQ